MSTSPYTSKASYYALLAGFNNLTEKYRILESINVDLKNKVYDLEENNGILKAEVESLKVANVIPCAPSQKTITKEPDIIKDEMITGMTEQLDFISLQIKSLVDDLEGYAITSSTSRHPIDELVKDLEKVELTVSSNLIPQLSRLNHFKTCLVNQPNNLPSFRTICSNEMYSMPVKDEIINVEDLQKLMDILKQQNKQLKQTQWDLKQLDNFTSSPKFTENTTQSFSKDEHTTLTDEWTFLPSR